ncbi:MAG: biopolymer transporter ExbD [Candidatus Firestonebacteria bacterium]|nr:biopolymer transporter ExbD [Candidatus Firestonebacteria bacterium]
MQFKKHGAELEDVDMELTSMTDMVFLLLSFFMLTGTFSMAKMDDKLEIQLPKAVVTTKQIKKKNIIEISMDNRVLFNGLLKSYQELDQELQKLSATDPDEVIIIKADKRVVHGTVIKVMGLCKKENLTNIGFAAMLDSNVESFTPE